MKRVLVVLGAACLLASALAGMVFLVRSQQRAGIVRKFTAAGPANLAREETAARQEGIVLDPRQLQSPLPPPARNAALLYTKLTGLLHDKPFGLPKYAENGMNYHHGYSPGQITEVRALLASRPEVMTLIHQAADCPQCVFVHDWSQMMLTDAPMPELQTTRQAARLLETESYLFAAQGRYAEAVADQARGFRIAAQVAPEPTLAPYLAGVSCQLITLVGMESILEWGNPNVAVCDQMAHALRTQGMPVSFKPGLKTEPALMEPLFQEMHKRQNSGIKGALSLLQDISSAKSPGLPPPPRPANPDSLDNLEDPQTVSDFIDAQKAEYLAEMRHLIAAVDLPEPTRTSLYASATQSNPDDAHQYVRVISLFMLPDVAMLGKYDLQVHTRERILLIATAALAEKAKTGSYPIKLPQEFTDPFTNKPLLYRREGESGFVVYSAGPTGSFDGGVPGEKTPTGELLFRYPAVPVSN